MNKSILIIEDDKIQADNLTKALNKEFSDTVIKFASEKVDMIDNIENSFFSLAIVDLRMDKLDIDGLKIIDLIIENNPFSKIVVISAFSHEYFKQLQKYVLGGHVVEISEKKTFDLWIPELKTIIDQYYSKLEVETSPISTSLLDVYSQVKNESNTQLKGSKFENFISLLFGSMGFNKIAKNVKSGIDKEIDLIIRNDIDDDFLSKFGKYFFVECKNKQKSDISKNDIIVFESKIKSSSGMCNTGIFCTTTQIPRTILDEMKRSAHDNEKIILLSNIEIERLITSIDRIEVFKEIIDSQVKNC